MTISPKAALRAALPAPLLAAYHFLKASIAAARYGFPTRRMVTIGVTGTKGKSSTANFIWAGLTGAGVKTALLSTANFRMGAAESVNPYHMTMPNPFILQSFLRRAFAAGCEAVIVETTSQGILQFRHRGIAYDFLVFTNLTPEHVEAHGSFEAYRATKEVIFRELFGQPRKQFRGRAVPKAIIVNVDSPEAPRFLAFAADQKLTYALDRAADFRATDIVEEKRGVRYRLRGVTVALRIPGRFSASNSLPAFAAGTLLDLPAEAIRRGLERLAVIPGRMETVIENPFTVIVDYAHEPESLSSMCATVRTAHPRGNLILLFGGTGGGRDRAKRPEMGRIAACTADYVVIANDDPFNENPDDIIAAIAGGARDVGKVPEVNLFLIPDRRVGIRKALSLAKPGDVVVIAGKGSEQVLILKHGKVPWDDRRIAREEFEKLGYGRKK